MADRPIVLAVVAGAHGIAGEVRLKLFTDDIAGLKAHKAFNGGTLTLKSVKAGSNGAIARFAEIADRTAAEGLRGTELSVPREALPPLAEGEYYHADIIGLPCFVEGEQVGQAVLIENFGAGDVLEIERPGGKRFMVPVAQAVTIEPDRLLVDSAFVE
ncbi:ribosome maturation factor RimM [Sphingomonas naphthae]|uniref:Ribosome maturation factor RimM n=1 Tax=Sphingomonas naphthae TaxID=1813468 RepID=A0ABY7TM77_9SPHN|nr:ribosome maturation factor RimM [Sphingomonas naphthae]WCT74330.1 ribosome maturation factor RimM [Sphingomonas naphthae]